jgi:uncharacterized membrane protein YhaH (DUF805 family)
MTFTAAIKTCFRKYVTFSGRASRPEYWWFFLFLILGSTAMGIFDGLLFGAGTFETEVTDTSAKVTAEADGPLATLFSLATLLPILAVGWRRMHDTGRSGLFLLYPLIAITGLISFIGMFKGFDAVTSGNVEEMMSGVLGVVFVLGALVVVLSPLIVLWWLTRPSQPGPNQYGPNPHEVTP